MSDKYNEFYLVRIDEVITSVVLDEAKDKVMLERKILTYIKLILDMVSTLNVTYNECSVSGSRNVHHFLTVEQTVVKDVVGRKFSHAVLLRMRSVATKVITAFEVWVECFGYRKFSVANLSFFERFMLAWIVITSENPLYCAYDRNIALLSSLASFMESSSYTPLLTEVLLKYSKAGFNTTADMQNVDVEGIPSKVVYLPFNLNAVPCNKEPKAPIRITRVANVMAGGLSIYLGMTVTQDVSVVAFAHSDQKVVFGVINDYVQSLSAYQKQSLKEDFHTQYYQKHKAKAYRLSSLEFEEVRTRERREGRVIASHHERSLDRSVLQFNRFLLAHGYNPTSMRKAPKQLVDTALRQYVDGYGLHNLHKLIRLNQLEQRLFNRDFVPQRINTSPEPGKDRRMITYKAWKEFLSKYGEIAEDTKYVKHMFTNLFDSKTTSSQEDLLKPKGKIPKKEKEKEEKDETMTEKMAKGALKAALSDKDVQSMVAQLATTATKSVIAEITTSATAFLQKCKDVIVEYLKPWTPYVVGAVVVIALVAVVRSCFSIATSVAMLKCFWSASNFLSYGTTDEEELSGYVKQGICETFVTAKQNFQSFRTFLHESSRTAISIKNLREFLNDSVNFTKQVIDFLSELITGAPYFDQTVRVENYLKNLEALMNIACHWSPGQVQTNAGQAREFLKAYDDLRAYSVTLAKSRVDVHIVTRVERLLSQAMPTYQSIYATFGSKDNRVEPVWINLYGKPKQGKTVLLNTLPAAIFGMMTQQTWSAMHLYARNMSETFWSKYENQYVCLFDDMFQTKDVTIRNAVASEFIRLANSAPCPLDMPDVVSKGCTNFTSRVIISSTNIRSESGYTDLGLVEMEAFLRRMTLSIEVTLKEGSQSDETITMLSPNSKAWDNYELKLTRRGSTVLKTPVLLTQQSLMQEIRQEMLKREKSHKEAITNAGTWSSYNPDQVFVMKDNNSSALPEVEKKVGSLPTLNYEPKQFDGGDDEDNVIPYKRQGLWGQTAWKRAVLAKNSLWCTRKKCANCTDSVISAIQEVCNGSKCPCQMYSHIPWDTFDVQSQVEIYRLVHQDRQKDIIHVVGQERGLRTFRYMVLEAAGQKDDNVVLKDALKMKVLNNIYFFGPAFKGCGLITGEAAQVFTVEERKIISQHFFGMTSFCRTYDEVISDPAVANWKNYTISFQRAPAYDKEDFEYSVRYVMSAGLHKWVEDVRWWQWLKYVVAGLISLTLFMSCVTAVCAILSNMGYDDKWEKESIKGDKYTNKLTKRVAQKAQSKGRPIPYQKQSADQAAGDLSVKVVTQNLFWLLVERESARSTGFALFVDGNTFVTNHHIWDHESEGGLPNRVTLYHGEQEIDLNIVGFSVQADRDLVFVKTIHGMSKPDIRKHIPSNEEKLPMTYETPTMVTLDPKGLLEVRMGNCAKRRETRINVAHTIYAPGVLECGGIRSNPGDCCSPYIMHGGHVHQKLVAVHGGGYNNRTLALPIYREDFSNIPLVDTFEEDVPYEQHGYIQQARLSKPFVNYEQVEYSLLPPVQAFVDGMKPAYSLKGVSISTPQQTQLIPTLLKTGVKESDPPLAPPWIVEEAPAKLRKGVVEGQQVDPNLLAYRHYRKKKVPPAPRELADMDVYRGIFTDEVIKRRETYRMATIEEAVFGWEEMSMPSIELSTSSAFPFVSKGIQRRQLIDFKKKWISPDVISEVNYILRKAEKGRVVPHFTIHCLKDETRPHSRVQAYLTRAFQIGALAHLIASRMAWMWLMSVVEHGQSGDIAVGINPYSYQWDMLFHKLNSFPCAKDTDTQAWDHHFMFHIVDPFTRAFSFFMNQNINSLGVRLLWATFRSSVEPFVVIGSHVYRCLMMASGTLITSFGNSIANSVKGRVIYKRLARLNAPELVNKFDDNVAQTVFGDDNILTFLELIKSWFNGKTMAEQALKLFGQTHTGTNKAVDDVLYKKLEECEYLKRKFLPSSGMIFAPLSMQSIHNMLQWIMKPKECSEGAQFSKNVEVAMFEVALYGPKVYSKTQQQVNAFLFAYGMAPHVISYEDTLCRHTDAKGLLAYIR